MDENWHLLEKFIDGRCSKDELPVVNMLLNRKEGRQLLDRVIEERELPEFKKTETPDFKLRKSSESVTVAVLDRIAAYERRPRIFSHRNIRRLSGVAAVLVGVVVLAGVMVWRGGDMAGRSGNGFGIVKLTELKNTDGFPAYHMLSDGTEIWLAAGSTLKFPATFDHNRRNVELQGEAFFNVARDEMRPFTIRTGAIETRVLGTSFKITAFEGHEQEVAVATGQVRVRRYGGEVLALLTSGTSILHDTATGETTRAEINPTTLEEWKTGALIFNMSPIGLVAEQLEARYNIEISFADPHIASRKVRITFSPEENLK